MGPATTYASLTDFQTWLCTIAMLLGLLVPTAGTITILGHDMAHDRFAALARMNFSSPYVSLPHRLTVAQNLRIPLLYTVNARPGHHLSLERAGSMADVQAAIRARAAGVPAGEFLTSMGGWNPVQFTEKRLPTLAELDAFIADKSPNAYEKVVDRLLASPRYGERMAFTWLEAARYADTNGYQTDAGRDMWRWRDWVIDAYNRNLPFDQFTIEQLAGDLLPNATLQQRVGSAYNRLLQTTEEGGAQAKEYIAKYSADRVRNYGQVWLGGTLMCAECHSHKFDPYTQADFYSVAAFFADIQEPAIGNRGPGVGSTPPFGALTSAAMATPSGGARRGCDRRRRPLRRAAAHQGQGHDRRGLGRDGRL